MSRWLASLVRPHAYLLILSLVGSVIQSAGTAGLTLTVKTLVDDVFLLRNPELLTQTILLLVAYGFGAQLGLFLSSFSIQVLAERVVKDLREKIFKRFLRAPLNVFLSSSSGDFIARTVSDLEGIRFVLSDQLPKLVREPFVILALFSVLLYRDAFLTLLLLFFFPGIYLLTKYFAAKKKKHLSRQREAVSRLTSLLAESFRGIENIKLFLAESRFLKWFSEISESFYRYSVRLALYITGNTVLNYLFGYSVVATLLFIGSLRIVKGDVSAGDFVSYLTALFMIQKPIMDLQKAVMNFKGSYPLFERIRFLLEVPTERSGTKLFKGLKREITFLDVSVQVNGKDILRDIKVSIRKGEKVGIRGPTGSGKSTFVRLIPALLEYEGRILLDDMELREFELTSLRRAVGFVTQEVFLFRGTVRENLLIANPRASDEEMKRALELALCDFILKSPEGLNYPVEEGGKNLSGGERQRLSLARLFLKNPEIVILDEATSALDRDTEAKILENLFTYFRDRTMFVVAHRESNLAYCETILNFEGGRLVGVERLNEESRK